MILIIIINFINYYMGSILLVVKSKKFYPPLLPVKKKPLSQGLFSYIYGIFILTLFQLIDYLCMHILY